MKNLHHLAGEIHKSLGIEGFRPRRFLRTIWGRVRRFGFHYDDTKEIVHEILSEILIKLENQEFRGQASVQTFAWRISQNICLKRLRRLTSLKRGGHFVHLPFDHYLHNVLHADPRTYNPLEILKRQEVYDLLHQCIERLENHEYRSVFSLLIQGYARREISEELDISLNRVDAVLHHGKKKLRRYLRRHVHPDPFQSFEL